MNTTDYCLYQITCGFDQDKEQLESFLFDSLNELYQKHNVVLTINSINYGNSIYSGKFPCQGEPVAMLFVSSNPVYLSNPREWIHWLAVKLCQKYNQYVVPYSALTPSHSVSVAKKNND